MVQATNESAPKSRSRNKLQLHFTKQNIELVKTLIAQGLSHKQIARRLSRYFVTANRHKKLSTRTISNLMQAEKHGGYPEPTYTDADAAHSEDGRVNFDDIVAESIMPEALELEAINESNDDIARQVVKSNLNENVKIALLKKLLVQ